MIPKYSINFSLKKPGKSPRASGLLDPGFGRAGPRKNGSGGRVLQARPVARNITSSQHYYYVDLTHITLPSGAKVFRLLV